MNTGVLLEMAAEGVPERVAVGSRDGKGLTYLELLRRACKAAGVIQRSEVQRVGWVGVNCAELPLLVYASAFAGVPFVPLNYRLADPRLVGLVQRIAPSLVVADEEAARRLGGLGDTVLTTKALDELMTAEEAPQAAEIDPDAVAFWLFTSGTTGEPKAALLRHRHLVAYVLSSVEFLGADEGEATLVSVPSYHIAGLATILSNTYAGRRIVYLAQFDPTRWVDLAARERVTHAMVVPTMLARILDVLEARGDGALPALRHLSYGGGRMPVAVVERAMALLPHVGFVNAYGLTETSSTIAVLGPDDHRAAWQSADPGVRARLGSVGRPLPGLDLEIRDALGEPVPVGTTGEIWVRGEQVAGEYDGRSVLTANGWFATRDGGHVDESGFLFVDGRIDDVIVRGGENMSPGEIEEVLLAHPAVVEAGVVGVPDDEWGEAVAAAVVLAPGSGATEQELQQWVRSRLRSSRVPKVIQVRNELPYNETGKLLRRVLRAELSA